jgi:hypothetical protein
MKKSEKISGIVLLIFVFIGLMSLIFIPINISITNILLLIDVYILCLIIAPIGIYSIICMVGSVFFDKNW